MAAEQPRANPTGRRVTITAIARAAGVSVPTVSRVVNGRSDVSPQTRERVEDLLRLHGYRGRPARPRASGLIDLVLNELDSPWALEIIRGVEEVAHGAGVAMAVSTVHRRGGVTSPWLPITRTRDIDGAILVTTDPDTQVGDELGRTELPVVVVDLVGLPMVDAPTIGATNWAGGLSATEHLLGLGHRRIGFIAGPRRLLCARARLDGYRAALEAAGLSVDDRLIWPGDFHHESGFKGGTALLDLPDRPTAIFAANDQMALGTYEAVRRHGLHVPDQVSVVGFDDLREVRWSSPPLTTVRQPLSEMGGLAARTLLRLTAGETLESPRLELATTLVVRDSTAPAPPPHRPHP